MEKLQLFFHSISVDSVLLNIIYTLLLFVAVAIIKSNVRRLIFHKIDDEKRSYMLNRVMGTSLNIVAIIVLIQLWFSVFKSLSTFLGLMTAGLAIALKDLLTDLAGYMFIMLKRPFQVGDRIQIADINGDVIEINPLQFTLLETGKWTVCNQSTGRLVTIPSSKVLDQPLFNYSKGFNWIWNEIEVVVTFESDWHTLKLKIEKLIESHTQDDQSQINADMMNARKNMFVNYSRTTPIVYVKTRDSGVSLTMRYLCNPKKTRSSESYLWESILTIISSSDSFTMAYNTQRVYLDPLP